MNTSGASAAASSPRRMSTPARCHSHDATKMLTIFHAGSFGSAVAARVKGAVPSARLLPLSDSAASFDELVRGAAFVGVALWRRYPTELDQLDEACARNQIPWS